MNAVQGKLLKQDETGRLSVFVTAGRGGGIQG